MEASDTQRSLSMRTPRVNVRNGQAPGHFHDKEMDRISPLSPGRAPQDPVKKVWKRGFIRLVFVSTLLWMLLIVFATSFHVWSCTTSIEFFSALCKSDSRVLDILGTMGFAPKPIHRCSIPVADDPDSIVIPEKGTPNELLQNLSYIQNDGPIPDGQSRPLFGGHQTWAQRENSFKLNTTMKVHCGFIKNGGAEMDDLDMRYAQKCRFVVASGIFDGYDVPNQPSNISVRSRNLFCFIMVVDEISLDFIKKNVSVVEDKDGGKWVGIWRLMTLHHSPFDEPRRNGKVPKILTHRLFPQAQYSIWIDGKMELIVDPLLMLERYLWRGKYTFAIARHKHHRSIYEEGDAIKRRKRYARPLVDLQMKIYRFEGMDDWSPMKKTRGDVPEGAVILREHTAMSNLFSCLWFNEVNLFTPRDQLSFGYAVYRLGYALKLFMFPNCEYNSLFILHRHNREHSSKIEWVKTLKELKESKEKKTSLMESRGGLGFWTPYPGNLDSVQIPDVKRIYAAG